MGCLRQYVYLSLFSQEMEFYAIETFGSTGKGVVHDVSCGCSFVHHLLSIMFIFLLELYLFIYWWA